MPKIFRSTILGAGLLAGVAISAYAQTDNVAALPPGAQAPTPPAAAVAPSADVGGPKPGELWSSQEKQTQPVRPSAVAYGGPKLGELWSTQEKQSGPVVPSPDSIGGPRPN
jgi:hypothetical protein